MRRQAPDRDHQRPLHRTQLGPRLARVRAPGRPGRGRHRGQPRIPRPPGPRQVHLVRGGAQYHRRGPGDLPLQHPAQPPQRPLGRRPAALPGDHQRHAAAAQRQHGPHRGPHPVRVHDVRPGARDPQRAHRVRGELRPGAGEVVLPLRLHGGAHRDAYPARGEPGRQRPDVRAAVRDGTAEDLDGTQGWPPVRLRGGRGRGRGAAHGPKLLGEGAETPPRMPARTRVPGPYGCGSRRRYRHAPPSLTHTA